MKTNEEMAKDFFCDEKKVNEFMKDKEFIDKASSGKATTQDYINEFKKFDINLNKSEAKEISNKTDELLSIPAEKLNDEAISNVVGGIDAGTAGALVYAGVAVLGGFACIPLGVAATYCAVEMEKAKKEGNVKEVNRLAKNYQTLMYSMAGVIGATGLVVGPYAGFKTYKFVNSL